MHAWYGEHGLAQEEAWIGNRVAKLRAVCGPCAPAAARPAPPVRTARGLLLALVPVAGPRGKRRRRYSRAAASDLPMVKPWAVACRASLAR